MSSQSFHRLLPAQVSRGCVVMRQPQQILSHMPRYRKQLSVLSAFPKVPQDTIPPPSAGDGSSKVLLHRMIAQPVPHSVVPSLLSSGCVVFAGRDRAPVVPPFVPEESHLPSCCPLPLTRGSPGLLRPMARHHPHPPRTSPAVHAPECNMDILH